MNRLFTYFVFASMVLFASASCSSFSARASARRAEKNISGSSRGFKESRKVKMAKRQQENRQSKLDRQYDKHVKNSRKRSYDIQSDDVKERMKRNEAALSAREKAKGKRTKAATRRGARKYR